MYELMVTVSEQPPEQDECDLAQRGTPHTVERGCLRPDRSATLNVPFEFVAA
jgi:hypothetical protein